MHGGGRESVVAPPDIRFELATSGPLLPFVHSYYLLRNEARDIGGVERVDIGQIRFLLKGRGELTFPGGRVEASRPVMVSGAGTAAAAYRARGPVHCFGVALRATGWKSLIGLPAHKVADRVIDGEELFGPDSLVLLDRLRRVGTLEEMIALVEPFLVARARRVPPAHIALAVAVREWAASDEPVIDSLYSRIAMSQRQVMRLCNEYFGSPPKHLERKFRAIRAAMRIYQGEDPADVADRFSDQSHMINEIKHFTGHTPGSLRAGIDPILAITLANESFHFLPDVIPESVDPGL
ncbi:MAG: AraC family transcriptional regulator [Pseudomonadota bacterium]